MIDRDDLWRRYTTLDPEAQREVLDFLEFLTARLRRSRRANPAGDLSHEPFVGMWSGRMDMSDGAVWVREERHREWGPPDG